MPELTEKKLVAFMKCLFCGFCFQVVYERNEVKGHVICPSCEKNNDSQKAVEFARKDCF